jgi:hypothetical protein
VIWLIERYFFNFIFLLILLISFFLYSLCNVIFSILQLKEVIATAFVTSMKGYEELICSKVQDLVLQVIQAFVSNSLGSQDTLKLTSSGEGSSKPDNVSLSTEKLVESEDHISEDNNDGNIQFYFFFMLFCLLCFAFCNPVLITAVLYAYGNHGDIR